MAGSVTLTGSVTGLQSGALTLGPLTIGASTPVGEVLTVALTTGDNSISIPTGASSVVIVPASSNTATLKVRTVNGDTGITVSKTNPTELAFDQPAGFTLYINASAGATVQVVVV